MQDTESPHPQPLSRARERGATIIAVATDVGAWRVVWPVLRELDRRGVPYRVMLAEPAASIARQDGVAHVRLTAPTPAERAETVLAEHPGALLLGTSVQAVVERVLARQARVPTLGVLDAMLFVERRFGEGLAELPDLLACPDEATAARLRQAGAPASALAVTGNPTLEEIGLAYASVRAAATEGARDPASAKDPEGAKDPGGAMHCVPTERSARSVGAQCIAPDSLPAPNSHLAPDCPPAPDSHLAPAHTPTDVLFVSSPVAAMRLRGAEFSIDEREALDDLLHVLAALPAPTPAGYRVRVRLHPVQRSEGLPAPPPGITLVSDDDPDRLASCARARVVVGLSSTLLGEARFLPRPSIAYLPGPFWQQERVFAPEYRVRLACSRPDLSVLLAEALHQPPPPAPLAGHLGAAGRIADLLATLPRA